MQFIRGMPSIARFPGCLTRVLLEVVIPVGLGHSIRPAVCFAKYSPSRLIYALRAQFASLANTLFTFLGNIKTIEMRVTNSEPDIVLAEGVAIEDCQ